MTDQVSTTRALRRLMGMVPSLRQGLLLTMVLAFFGTAIQIAVPVVVQQIIDDDILGGGGIDATGAVQKGVVALVFMVLATFARRSSTLRLSKTSARGLSDLRVVVFEHLHKLSVLHVEAERRGALVARVTSDVYRVQDFMEWGGMGLVIGISQVALAVIAMVFYRWELALGVVGGVTVYGAMLIWFQKVLARAHNQVRERVADSMSAVSESISGLPVVRAFGAEGPTLLRVSGAVDAQFKAEFRTSTLGSTLFSSAEIFAGVLTAGVIAAGVLLGAASGLTAGELLAFLFLVNLLVQPVQTMVESLDIAQAAAAGIRRVLEVLDTPVDLADPIDGVELPPGALDVRVESLRFRYPTGGDVLTDVNIEIPAGRRVAVVGETGSGKTTIMKLVVRLLDPTEGSVLIGNIPVGHVAFWSLRSRVAFVPQEGFLFDTTVAENIRYGRPAVDDSGILAAVSDLGLDEWIATLPAGLGTEVGERGSQLSAGERQLVALIRAWLVQPDLLVLDEATSAVDPALEVQLRRAMDRLIAGRTSITVAHRLSTAEAADDVLVFDQGRLVEKGTHQELIAMNGVYAAMHVDWMAGTRM